MSAIASFYLVPNQDLARLQDLAVQPAGQGPDGRWHDPMWDFIHKHGRELEAYAWSGHVIGSEVYFYLESCDASLEDYADQPLSDAIAEAREESVWAFRAEPSRRLVQIIDAHWPDESTLNAFLHSEDMLRSDGDVAPVGAVLDGLAILKKWLAQVDEGNIGLLRIG